LAAEHGNPKAQFNLGQIYMKGEVVPQDYGEAMSWFEQAAQQGDPLAQTNLAFMYAHAVGVPRDYVTAYMWWTLAAERGDDAANAGLNGIVGQMTPEEIAEAEALAGQWQPR
jgi:uncharacterized protein